MIFFKKNGIIKNQFTKNALLIKAASSSSPTIHDALKGIADDSSVPHVTVPKEKLEGLHPAHARVTASTEGPMPSTALPHNPKVGSDGATLSTLPTHVHRLIDAPMRGLGNVAKWLLPSVHGLFATGGAPDLLTAPVHVPSDTDAIIMENKAKGLGLAHVPVDTAVPVDTTNPSASSTPFKQAGNWQFNSAGKLEFFPSTVDDVPSLPRSIRDTIGDRRTMNADDLLANGQVLGTRVGQSKGNEGGVRALSTWIAGQPFYHAIANRAAGAARGTPGLFTNGRLHLDMIAIKGRRQAVAAANKVADAIEPMGGSVGKIAARLIKTRARDAIAKADVENGNLDFGERRFGIDGDPQTRSNGKGTFYLGQEGQGSSERAVHTAYSQMNDVFSNHLSIDARHVDMANSIDHPSIKHAISRVYRTVLHHVRDLGRVLPVDQDGKPIALHMGNPATSGRVIDDKGLSTGLVRPDASLLATDAGSLDHAARELEIKNAHENGEGPDDHAPMEFFREGERSSTQRFDAGSGQNVSFKLMPMKDPLSEDDAYDPDKLVDGTGNSDTGDARKGGTLTTHVHFGKTHMAIALEHTITAADKSSTRVVLGVHKVEYPEITQQDMMGPVSDRDYMNAFTKSDASKTDTDIQTIHAWEKHNGDASKYLLLDRAGVGQEFLADYVKKHGAAPKQAGTLQETIQKEQLNGTTNAQDLWQFRYNFALMYSQKMMAEHVASEAVKMALALHGGDAAVRYGQSGLNIEKRKIGKSPPVLANGAQYIQRQIGLPLNTSPLEALNVEGSSGRSILREFGNQKVPDMPSSPPRDDQRTTLSVNDLQPQEHINPGGIAPKPLDGEMMESVLGKSALALPKELGFAPLLADDRKEATRAMGIDQSNQTDPLRVSTLVIRYFSSLTDRPGSNKGIFIAHGKQKKIDLEQKADDSKLAPPRSGIVLTTNDSPVYGTEKVGGIDHRFVTVNVTFSAVERRKQTPESPERYGLALANGQSVEPRTAQIKIPLLEENGRYFPDLSDLRKKTALMATFLDPPAGRPPVVASGILGTTAHAGSSIVLSQDHTNSNVPLVDADNEDHVTNMQNASGWKIAKSFGKFFSQRTGVISGTAGSHTTGTIVARRGNLMIIMTGRPDTGTSEDDSKNYADDDRDISVKNASWSRMTELAKKLQVETGRVLGDGTVPGGLSYGAVSSSQGTHDPIVGGLHVALEGSDRSMLGAGKVDTIPSGVRFIVVHAQDGSKLATKYSEGAVVKNIDGIDSNTQELSASAKDLSDYFSALQDSLENPSAATATALSLAEKPFQTGGSAPDVIKHLVESTRKKTDEIGTRIPRGTDSTVLDQLIQEQIDAEKIAYVKSVGDAFKDGSIDFQREDAAIKEAADFQEKDPDSGNLAATKLGEKIIDKPLTYRQAFGELAGILEKINQDDAVTKIRAAAPFGSSDSTETLLENLRSKTASDPSLNVHASFPVTAPQRPADAVETYVVPDLYAPKETGGSLISKNSGTAIEDSIHMYLPDFIRKKLNADKTKIVIHSGTRDQIQDSMQIDGHPDIVAEKANPTYDGSATTWTAPDGTIFLGTATGHHDKKTAYESLVDEIGKSFNNGGAITRDAGYRAEVDAKVAAGIADPSVSGLSGDARYEQAYKLDFIDNTGENAAATPFDLRKNNDFDQEVEGQDRIKGYDIPALGQQIVSPVTSPAMRASIQDPTQNGGVSLTSGQKQAVEADGQAVKVIAGVGSGKTTAIAMRIQDLIQARAIDPSKILAFSFTSFSAEDLKDRVKRRLSMQQGEKIDRNIGTFHAITRRWIASPMATGQYRIQIPGFNDDATNRRLGDPAKRYISSDTSKDILTQIIRSQQESTKLLNEKEIIKAVSEMREKSEIPEETTDKTVTSVYRLFEKKLEQDGLMDYASSMRRTTEALENDPALRATFLRDFTHVHVDEFQDVNKQQFRLIMALTPKGGGNLFVVGDPNQAIYGFRGGKNEYIDKFDQYFSRNGTPPLEVSLNVNQRSGSTLVDGTNAIGNAITGRNGSYQQQVSRPQRGLGGAVHSFVPTSLSKGKSSAMEYMAKTIKELFDKKELQELPNAQQGDLRIIDPAQKNPCAILCRTNEECENVAKKLAEMGIKTKHREKGANLTEEEEKKEEMRFKTEQGIPVITVHTSKGLEFDHVFMYGTDEGVFPKVGRETRGDNAAIKDTQEGNLFYVGFSRAKKSTYMVGTTPKEARWVTDIRQGIDPNNNRNLAFVRRHAVSS